MSFGTLLKEARKSKKYSQQDLADIIGVNRVAIANYELDKNTPTHSNMIKLLDALDLSADYFRDDDNINAVGLVPIKGEASCGLPISSSTQYSGKKCAYNGKFFHNDLYCVIACGDSMSPEIEDGDEIICDHRVTPQHGDLVHYTMHNESAVKLYVVDIDANIIQFVPYNQSEDFKTKTVRLDDADSTDSLTIVKVVSVNKLKFNNRLARLRMIGRA